MAILLLLDQSESPLTTKKIIESLGLKSWTRATRTLFKLEEANIMVRAERYVGMHSSRAIVWQLEPEDGDKVVDALKEAERWIDHAHNKKNASLPTGSG